MTRQGVDFGSIIKPQQIENLLAAQDDLRVWQSIGETLKWGRLYGGAIGVIQIDGQDSSTPLNVDTLAKDQFKGILPLSRWELNPTVTDVVQSMGPVIGKPEIYHVGPNATAMQNAAIHHSRVIRIEGIRLPFFQRIAEQGWGLSVIERMYDRLLAYDSATTGAAQLVFKAYLRTLKVQGLRKILGAGGAAEAALTKNVEAIRQFQSTEGLTLIDAEDAFEAFTYTFAGLNDLLLGFGQQLSGATQIPLIRLFGQAPAGLNALNATGDSDIRNYYDSIKARQESDLRAPVNLIMKVMYRSVIGGPPPAGFRVQFNPCWQLSEIEKAGIAKTIGETVGAALDDGIIDKPTALKELKQSAESTGVFTNISDEMIKEAELEPPEPGIGEPPGPDDGPQSPAGPPVEPGPKVPGPQSGPAELRPN
jgi:phage-related protein (TIGR01555 family)